MNKSFQLTSINPIAKEILQIVDSKVLLFYGELGVGKTTLIGEIVKELGASNDVSSPTFSIVNEYEVKEGLVFHFDFFRIENEEEVYDIGFEDYLDSGNWIFIEWPEKIETLLPDHFNEIWLKKEDDNSRKIKLKKLINI
ncbi:MAG: tRNA (adenosine(37)-N6)-threonylcarbamoyltransferase complex ATPase subunit type 1 TsaE [Bacteroidia bacterium]|nr:tRNA (adenosine(37)-N6)-threonylcarbamoyltransferase complex ATPase subunit type 1 TsaE [Bacteroidia bacterium]